MFKWLIPLTWVMTNLVYATLVAPGPAMVLVNFSMAASTCLLRWHAWEYFIVVQVTLIGFVQELGLSVWSMILSWCLNFSTSVTLLQPQHHHHLYCILSPPNADWGQS